MQPFMALRPAHDVYHRLRWDPSIDETTAEVVVLDRRRGPVALPFLAFDPAGDIPWSRVLGFRLEGEVVWDREARIDRVFGSGATPGEGLGSRPRPRTDDVAVRVLTLNVLFDRYDREAIQTAQRTPKLLALLEQTDADLVALQEVEPWLCARLVDEGVIGTWHATDDARGETVQPYGQLLLSRFPILGHQIVPLGGDKRHLVASVALPAGRTTVVVVHLSSDRHGDAPQRRARQLAVLRARLGAGPALVLGDVNQDEPVDLPLDDAWTERHPDDPGYTWDPARNVLARRISRTGARRRLDRVLVRGFSIDDIELVGVDPSDLPLSDHHGLLATLRPAPLPVRDEAWILPLPRSAARRLEPLRRRFDPGRFRWPPHLTLQRGPHRLSASQRADASGALGTRLTLIGATTFAGPPRRVVATLDETGEQAIGALRSALGMPDDGRPHVTVGTVHDPQTETALLRAVRAELPLTFPVGSVDHVVRTDDGPVHVADRIDESPGPPRLEEVLDLHGLSTTPDEDVTALLDRLAEATGGPTTLVGSARLGAHLPEGDLDIVVAHPDPDAAHRSLRRAFGVTTTPGTVDVTRLTVDLGDPALPRPVDVSVVTPDDPAPGPQWAALATQLDATGVQVLRALKGWAAARQVHDPAWGFVPGLALAHLVAATDGDVLHERFLAALEALRNLASELAEGRSPDLPTVRFVVLPAVAATLVEEAERALVYGWDARWTAVFSTARVESGDGAEIELSGPSPTLPALRGWLRGRIAHSLDTLQQGSNALLRIRPYPRPQRRRGPTLRYRVRWAHAAEIAVTQALAELHERFESSADRPPGTTLQIART
ncbi:MAG: RNA repair domain-containing protein [Myxococcota bacterium]